MFVFVWACGRFAVVGDLRFVSRCDFSLSRTRLTTRSHLKEHGRGIPGADTVGVSKSEALSVVLSGGLLETPWMVQVHPYIYNILYIIYIVYIFYIYPFVCTDRLGQRSPSHSDRTTHYSLLVWATRWASLLGPRSRIHRSAWPGSWVVTFFFLRFSSVHSVLLGILLESAWNIQVV